MGMEICIERLDPSRMQDFFRFFDGPAFADHTEWAGCYCLESHLMSRDNQEYLPDGTVLRREDRKQAAEDLIRAGILTGYLAYDGLDPVGWCNAGDLATFTPLLRNGMFGPEEVPAGQNCLVYCFDIALAYRGRGIAGRFLERILQDAAAEGYRTVEAVPYSDETFAWQYHGPRRFWLKHGFRQVRDCGWCTVLQREL